MPAVILAIADAVTDTLNAASLSQGFTAERLYVPAYDAETLVGLKVAVVPRTLEAASLSRRDDDFTYGIGVAIQERFKPADAYDDDPADVLTTEALDDRMQLVEEIIDLFRNKPLDMGAYAGTEAVRCTAVENDPIYVPADLDEKRLFTSVILLTFQSVRAKTA